VCLLRRDEISATYQETLSGLKQQLKYAGKRWIVEGKLITFSSIKGVLAEGSLSKKLCIGSKD
jgi:hypothetical protein